MLVFWDQGLVLLATPKTGSTALAAALGAQATIRIGQPSVLKHTNVQRYHRFVGPYLAAASGRHFEVMALIRQPLDWLGSWYRFRTRPELTDETRITADMSFDDFVQAYCTDKPPEFAAVGSQERFLRPRNGAGVDHLFRYEDMDKAVSFLENRLERPIQLSRHNISPEAPLDLALVTEARLRRTLAPDFALYASLGGQ